MDIIIEIRIYETKANESPFLIWLNKLDKNERFIIRSRLNRILNGNFGACKPLRNGIWEIIIDHGPGYRIYFGKIENTVILLLCAGNKGSQERDIEKAVGFWFDYKE